MIFLRDLGLNIYIHDFLNPGIHFGPQISVVVRLPLREQTAKQFKSRNAINGSPTRLGSVSVIWAQMNDSPNEFRSVG